MNRILFLIPCAFFIFLTVANSGEIYTYKDKDGITVISNTPIPERYEKKAKKIGSSGDSTPSGRYQGEGEDELRKQHIATQEDQSQKTNDQEMNKRVELEKRRLEKNKEYFTNKPPVAGDKSSAESFRRQAQSYEKKSKELEADPESYFYNKKEREREI